MAIWTKKCDRNIIFKILFLDLSNTHIMHAICDKHESKVGISPIYYVTNITAHKAIAFYKQTSYIQTHTQWRREKDQ